MSLFLSAISMARLMSIDRSSLIRRTERNSGASSVTAPVGTCGRTASASCDAARRSARSGIEDPCPQLLQLFMDLLPVVAEVLEDVGERLREGRLDIRIVVELDIEAD